MQLFLKYNIKYAPLLLELLIHNHNCLHCNMFYEYQVIDLFRFILFFILNFEFIEMFKLSVG